MKLRELNTLLRFQSGAIMRSWTNGFCIFMISITVLFPFAERSFAEDFIPVEDRIIINEALIGTEAEFEFRESLENLTFDWVNYLPTTIIRLEPVREDNIRGLAYISNLEIVIFYNGYEDFAMDHILLHEMGHIIDLSLNSVEDRSRWKAEREIKDDVPWWPDAFASDFSTGAGDFAESFAVWHNEDDPFAYSRSNVGAELDDADFRLMEEIVYGRADYSWNSWLGTIDFFDYLLYHKYS